MGDNPAAEFMIEQLDAEGRPREDALHAMCAQVVGQPLFDDARRLPGCVTGSCARPLEGDRMVMQTHYTEVVDAAPRAWAWWPPHQTPDVRARQTGASGLPAAKSFRGAAVKWVSSYRTKSIRLYSHTTAAAGTSAGSRKRTASATFAAV